MRFQVNNPRVMHETIEGEVILINLDTGTYYSLRDAGALVWRGVEQHADEEEIVAGLERTYSGAVAEMRETVTALLDELRQEQLISPFDSEVTAGPDFDSLGVGGGPFRPPVLEKHTDMQDLILIDPVHQVDARGWPHRAPEDQPA
jgi:hypothetical protein